MFSTLWKISPRPFCSFSWRLDDSCYTKVDPIDLPDSNRQSCLHLGFEPQMIQIVREDSALQSSFDEDAGWSSSYRPNTPHHDDQPSKQSSCLLLAIIDIYSLIQNYIQVEKSHRNMMVIIRSNYNLLSGSWGIRKPAKNFPICV
jgi:hypothetical protein